jgi:hypothetical protein
MKKAPRNTSRVSKTRFDLSLGPPDIEIIQELDKLPYTAAISSEKDAEILRRGLHSARYLMEVDEKVLLEILHEYLTSFNKSSAEKDLTIAKNLAFSIYAAMISKHGIFKADSFGSLPMELKLFEQAKKEQQASTKMPGGSQLASSSEPSQPPPSDDAIKKGVAEITDTVSTVYLARS